MCLVTVFHVEMLLILIVALFLVHGIGPGKAFHSVELEAFQDSNAEGKESLFVSRAI